jgi:predicted short-subunit dehydrogenase-like oxidoreductase (DUF2520 family)
MTLLLNIIGAGKLGKTLGYLLQKHPQIEIQGVVNRTLDSGKNACKFMGAGKAYSSVQDLPHADITLLSVPDNHIKNIVNMLYDFNGIKPDSVIFHCSGALSSSLFSKLPVHPLSVHPIKSFASPDIGIQAFSGSICTYEGDQHAIEILVPIFLEIGARCIPISSANKSLYHASCVMACNYLITLADVAQHCFIESGLNKENAFEAVTQLMSDALINLISTQETQCALTGPLQRGDHETIMQHIQSIQDPEILELYQILGQATLKLTPHEKDVIISLKNLLKNRKSIHE